MAHEIRDMLNTAVFAFDALRKGNVGINGNTGAVVLSWRCDGWC